MGNKNRKKDNLGRRLRIRSVRRNPPDLKKLASALIELARAQAEADAKAEHVRHDAAERRRSRPSTETDGGDE